MDTAVWPILDGVFPEFFSRLSGSKNSVKPIIQLDYLSQKTVGSR